MKINDAELKRLLQDGMDYEADCIMAEVESDPSMQDVVAPEAIYDNLLQQIREYEEEKEKENGSLSQEEQELIRLGKIYKKKRGRRKYLVLIAAIVCAFGVGTISFGGGKKVFTELQRMLGDRKQTVVNNGDGDRHIDRGDVSEEEAYKQIEEMFGFWPVRMYYLPEGMEFQEINIEENLQFAQLCYTNGKEGRLSYWIVTKHRTSSSTADVEDKLVQEYTKEVGGVDTIIQEYLIEENETTKWKVVFIYEDAQYSIVVTEISQQELERIVENLYFS